MYGRIRKNPFVETRKKLSGILLRKLFFSVAKKGKIPKKRHKKNNLKENKKIIEKIRIFT